MGSKNRIAKFIVPVLEANREPFQWYIEPFVGGANMIDKMSGNRAGFDSNEYLIEALKLIRDNPNSIPDLITESDYKEIKDKKIINGLTGFVAFEMSFGGKFFGGYRRDKIGKRDYSREGKNNALKQSKNIQGIHFETRKFQGLKLFEPCLIYCDPPYKGTTKYKDEFNHNEFWDWCRLMVKKGHKVFISEYNAPDDFISVWSQEINNNLNGLKASEKLFIHKSQLVCFKKLDR